MHKGYDVVAQEALLIDQLVQALRRGEFGGGGGAAQPAVVVVCVLVFGALHQAVRVRDAAGGRVGRVLNQGTVQRLKMQGGTAGSRGRRVWRLPGSRCI